MSEHSSENDLTLELLRRYDRPGPRYTSYPTAVEFHEEFTESDYLSRLARADASPKEPLSLYVHLPFCRERCNYCGCNVVIARRGDVIEHYLEFLERELDLVTAALPHRRGVSQYHWGGGTPTYLTVPQMERLHGLFARHFDFLPDAELAIEIDPRCTDAEQVRKLRQLGFNRLSLGVQDFTPEVQEAIGRRQTEVETRTLYEECRKNEFGSINFDLIYGLPNQTEGTMERSMRSVIELRPDRVAIYSYAHVPWIMAHQKRIDEELLPSAELKLKLFLQARARLIGEGYVPIGMDHFALPTDELVEAMEQRTLHRNFMGYTVKSGADALGLGVSAIGDVAGCFAQNTKKLSRYYKALDDGRLPIERGYTLDADDLIRRYVVTQLMCNFRVDRDEVWRRFGVAFEDYFAEEIETLKREDGEVELGFVEIGPARLDVVGKGRWFVRNVCMIFDRHLGERQTGQRLFSRTV